eukprot:CAMPEP_0203750196 /NCGR_PEP_ID=MMETSP0098-20131031/4462_1 /ASSEMBLY_ACC=CAM_ASM_000208 /TAXON_ID=96639 /ORGANISM=" , Strain NY0313808BC1" /LENGTH=848 /DNA_ID=CAMNT_0050639377 /DNA_START=357 /DNA_END=2899 /DNA_ORIENTATION=-
MEEGLLLDNVRLLVEKERKLMELQLLEKEKELDGLRDTLSKQKRLLAKRHSTNVGAGEPIALGSDSEDDLSLEDEDDDEIGEMGEIGGVQGLDLGDPKTFGSLERLDLRSQGLNDVSMGKLSQALAHVPSLRELDISGNDLGDGCAGTIAAIISHRKICLKRINLSKNRFTLSGAQTIARSICRNEVLKHIDLSENPFYNHHDAGRMLGSAFESTACKLESITVTVADPRRDRTAKTAKGNCCNFISGILKSHSNISCIGLVQSAIPRAAVTLLSNDGLAKAYIRELDLSMGFIGSGGATLIGKAIVKANREVGCLNPTDARYALRVRNSHRDRLCLLEKLVLKMNAIGPSGCVWLARALATSLTLRVVDLSSNELNVDALGSFATAIKKTKAPLVCLNVARNQFKLNGAIEKELANAEEMADAIASKPSLISFGPLEELWLSVKPKTFIVHTLKQNQYLKNQADQGQNIDKGSDEKSRIVIYEQPERRTLLDFCKSQRALAERTLEIVNIKLPPTLTYLEMQDFDDEDEPGVCIVVDWQTNPGIKWKINRIRIDANHGHSNPKTIASGGASERAKQVTSERPNDRIKSWQSYSVKVQGWKAGDRLLLELHLSKSIPIDSVTHGLTGAFLQNILVHAHASNSMMSAPITPSMHSEKTSFPKDGPITLHQRSQKLGVLIKTNTLNAPNIFTKIHDIYVHSGTRSGRLVLAWNTKLETLSGKTVKNRRDLRYNIAGADWKIQKNGSNTQVLCGSAESSRVPPRPQIASSARDTEEFATYVVDLSKLNVFVGDTISLWVRPPNDSALLRSRMKAMYTLYTCDVQLQVFQDDKDANTEHDRIDLAGGQPFHT